jgi:hypothetical protein
LVLSNITSVFGAITTAYHNPDGSYPTTPFLTSIEAKVLTRATFIEISDAPDLKSISFPLLSQVQRININNVSGPTIDFPSVSTLSGALSISGSVSRYLNNYVQSAISARC